MIHYILEQNAAPRIFAWTSPCVSVYPLKTWSKPQLVLLSLPELWLLHSTRVILPRHTSVFALPSSLFRCSGLVAAFQLPPAPFLQVLPHALNTLSTDLGDWGKKIALLYRYYLSYTTSLLKAHLAFLSYQGPLTRTIAHSFKSPLLTDYNRVLIYPSQNPI